MRSITFVPKKSCRAIQLADLFAYYSRRDFVVLLKAHAQGKQGSRRTMSTRCYA
jgi:hypothetical protein